ncbi:Alpha/Beta hydrolase fold [Amanita muscaria]
MIDVVEHFREDVNFWDYICIAASLALLPTFLIRILVTKPFTPYTRRKPWRRLLGDAAARYLNGLDIKHLRYAMGTTPRVYATWAKWYNLPTTVTELGNGARLLWIGPKRMEKVILYLHGGGYVSPIHYCFASFWRYVQQELESRGAKVGIAILNYTLIPTEPFPAQLRQAVSAVEYLLSNGVQPENMQIVGDSAGGNLALALLSHVLHPLDDIPPITLKKPFGGMYMMSPWVRLSTNDSDTDSNVRNDTHDVITEPLLTKLATIVLAGLPDSLTSYIEPSLTPEGWFKDAHTYVKRFLITVGDKEYLREDINKFVHGFRRENKETQFVMQPDGVHNDPYFDFLVSQPKLGVLTPVIVDWVHGGFD